MWTECVTTSRTLWRLEGVIFPFSSTKMTSSIANLYDYVMFVWTSITLHHFLSVSLMIHGAYNYFKHCKIAQNRHDSYTLLSQCGINLVYYLICIHNGLSNLIRVPLWMIELFAYPGTKICLDTPVVYRELRKIYWNLQDNMEIS